MIRVFAFSSHLTIEIQHFYRITTDENKDVNDNDWMLLLVQSDAINLDKAFSEKWLNVCICQVGMYQVIESVTLYYYIDHHDRHKLRHDNKKMWSTFTISTSESVHPMYHRDHPSTCPWSSS